MDYRRSAIIGGIGLVIGCLVIVAATTVTEIVRLISTTEE